MAKQVPWSYSVLTAFETCPWRYYLTKIAKKIQEPQTQATVWGNNVHKACENRLLKGTVMPAEMAMYQPTVDAVKARGKGARLEAEQKMALNANFMGVTWFAKDVWVRGITDVTICKGSKAFIGDWKTGKRDPQSAQLKLTAAMTFAVKPHIQTIINSFIWLKEGATDTEVFQREDAPAIWQEFAPRVQRLEIAHEENKFPKRPSGLCAKWCPVGKTNCEHCGT